MTSCSHHLCQKFLNENELKYFEDNELDYIGYYCSNHWCQCMPKRHHHNG